MCDCLMCKTMIPSLMRLGFSISDTNYHEDIIEALSQCKIVKNEDSCPEFLGEQVTNIKPSKLDEIIGYLQQVYGELTIGGMSDSEGVCIEVMEYIIFLKELQKKVIHEEAVKFDNEGLRDFIQENFKEYFHSVTLTDEELEQFKSILEASLNDWISDNWRDFMQNRGD